MPVDAEFFVYTGPGGEGVPLGVVRVLVDPSVTSIPPHAFEGRKKLAEVELCEGVVEIGEGVFDWCDRSIKIINIPASLRRICGYAFAGSLRCPIRLHNVIESIGRNAFAGCIFTNFRVPPLITVIPDYMLYGCRAMFSLELPYSAAEIRNHAFKCWPKENIENMLQVKQMHFPEQPLDWGFMQDNFVYNSSHLSFSITFRELITFLLMCSMSARVEALAFKVWRDYMTNLIHSADFKHNDDGTNYLILPRIRAKIAHFEGEYTNLKKVTTVLELALWKLRMNENIPQEEATHYQKKIKTDESSMRSQCRITCGADVIIRHILPYLITVG